MLEEGSVLWSTREYRGVDLEHLARSKLWSCSRACVLGVGGVFVLLLLIALFVTIHDS